MANKDAIEVNSPYDFVKNQYELSMVRGSYEDDYVPYFGIYDDMDLYENVQGNDWIQQVFGNTGTKYPEVRTR